MNSIYLLFDYFGELSLKLVLKIKRFHIYFGIVVKRLLNEKALMVLWFRSYKHYSTIVICLDNLVIRNIINNVFARAMPDKQMDWKSVTLVTRKVDNMKVEVKNM